MTKIKNIKPKWILLLLGLLLLTMTPGAIAHYALPEKIHLIKDQAQVFSFSIPVQAVFNSENTAAFKINDSDEASNVNLSNEFTLLSTETGETEVTVSVFGVLPVKTITVSTLPDMDVVPSGAAVGVRINTDGVMVLGTGIVKASTGEELEPAKNVLKAGDLILALNGTPIVDKKELTQAIEGSGGEDILFRIRRGAETLEATLTPVLSEDNDSYKLGIWVRDSTQGIGTVTYYDPQSKRFAALGHGILDVDTKKLMTIKDGQIMHSSITSAREGKKGVPGELLGDIDKNQNLGEIRSNTTFGVYGYLNDEGLTALENTPMKIALQTEVVEGEAYILTTVNGDTPKKYKVQIESINKYSNDDSKGMIVRITDPLLLAKTNGIVQGMSGSPIIQNDKLVGAVTHVFVQEPTKGYGIFIENMLKSEEEI